MFITLKKLDLFLIILTQLLIFFLCFLFLDYSHDIHLARNLLIFIFLLSVLISLIDRPFNIFQIFLLVLLIFNLALPIFESIGIYRYPVDFKIMESDGIKQIVSKESIYTMYSIFIYFLIGASIGWLLGILSTYNWYLNSYLKLYNKNYHEKFYYIIKIIFLLIFILVTYSNIMLVIQSRTLGYIEVMHLSSYSSIIFELADALYKVVGVMLLFMSKDKKQFIRYAFIFMIPFFIQFFTGARGETISLIVVLVFVYTIIHDSFSVKKLLFFGTLIFLLTIFIGIARFSDNIMLAVNEMSFFDIFLGSIISSSKSLGVVAYTIELKEHFINKVPFIFGYFDSIFSFARNYSLEGIEEKSYLAQHITYLTNPEKLFNGSTIGSSIVAESFEFSNGNSIVILIFAGVSLFFARIIPLLMVRNIYLFYFGFVFLEAFILSPRGSIMKFLNKEFVLSLIFISLVMFFISLVMLSFKDKEQKNFVNLNRNIE